jgi:hypothetical protein
MDYKDNAGVDPVTLSRGYTKLDGDPPNSGESITDPRHVREKRRMEQLMADNPWPDMKEGDHGPEGFLERDLPDPYLRPNRTDSEDQG